MTEDKSSLLLVPSKAKEVVRKRSDKLLQEEKKDKEQINNQPRFVRRGSVLSHI